MPSIAIASYEGVSDGPPGESKADIRIVNTTTFKMAEQLVQEGYTPLVLDMANKSSPGGSVLKGDPAQEETLCRQSNLFQGLKRAQALGFYPLPEEGGILLTEVTFFRNDEYLFLERSFQAEVFASAAFDCNLEHQPDPKQDLLGFDRPIDDVVYREKTKMKMRAMCLAAKENRNDALVLGAFGCGAFRNDPHLISQWYKEVLNEVEFQDSFKIISFAIKDGKGNNFKVFTEILGR